MTTPQPPNINFEVLFDAVAPAYTRLFDVVLIGNDIGGTAATDPITTDLVPIGPYNSAGEALMHVAGSSPLAKGIRALFNNDITPSVYLIATDATAAVGAALRADVLAAVTAAKGINPPVDFIYIVDVSDLGYTDGTAGVVAAGAATSNIAAALESACEEIDAVGVMDSPHLTLANYVAWLDQAASPARNRVRPIFGRIGVAADHEPAGGFFLGAAIRQASRFGRQAGINLAPVLGVGSLVEDLSYSVIGSIDTDVKNLVNAYGSAIFSGDSGYALIGDTFKGADPNDPRRFWSPLISVDYALTQARIAAAPLLGNDATGNTRSYRRGLAVVIAESLGESVLNGELAGARARPHPTRNTRASIAARRVVIQTFLTVILPTNEITVEANLVL